jgi:hypothetical protein
VHGKENRATYSARGFQMQTQVYHEKPVCSTHLACVNDFLSNKSSQLINGFSSNNSHFHQMNPVNSINEHFFIKGFTFNSRLREKKTENKHAYQVTRQVRVDETAYSAPVLAAGRGRLIRRPPSPSSRNRRVFLRRLRIYSASAAASCLPGTDWRVVPHAVRSGEAARGSRKEGGVGRRCGQGFE